MERISMTEGLKYGDPSMSDFPGEKSWHYHDVIYNICLGAWPKYRTYLEIGVAKGYWCMRMAEHFDTVAVDVDDKALRNYFDPERVKKQEDLTFSKVDFHLKSSDDFFLENKKKFDIIFIDGSHHGKQVIRDFDNSIKCLNDNGIIFLHDTSPAGPRMQCEGLCGTALEVEGHIELNYPELKFVNLPDGPAGLMIVHGKERRHSDQAAWLESHPLDCECKCCRYYANLE